MSDKSKCPNQETLVINGCTYLCESLVESLKAEAWRTGEKMGRLNGTSGTSKAALKEAKALGYEEGFAKGHAEGYFKGYAAGQASIKPIDIPQEAANILGLPTKVLRELNNLKPLSMRHKEVLLGALRDLGLIIIPVAGQYEDVMVRKVSPEYFKTCSSLNLQFRSLTEGTPMSPVLPRLKVRPGDTVRLIILKRDEE